MNMIRIAAATIIVTLLAGLARVGAAVPDRDWPSVEVTPALDVPMRDPAITRGPDGIYYLTGTVGQPLADGTIDFDNSGIHLWKSRDLKNWEKIGVVWDFSKGGGWQRYLRMLPGSSPNKWARGAVAPELHFIKGQCWICFSINGQGTGLLRSTSGKPEGPYEDWARITEWGNHPSLFEDDDGAVYYLTDGGWMAKLTADMKMLAERPRLLQPEPDPRYHKPGQPRNDTWLCDSPKAVGERGVFLFKAHGRYFLTAASFTGRLGTSCDDTWIAYADNVLGPYSGRHLMIPHGGGVTVFIGPDSTAVNEYRGPYDIARKKSLPGPQYYATFAGNDSRAIFRDRPAFLSCNRIRASRNTCSPSAARGARCARSSRTSSCATRGFSSGRTAPITCPVRPIVILANCPSGGRTTCCAGSGCRRCGATTKSSG
jgi:xylan 1,4-beta-xylosidase